MKTLTALILVAFLSGCAATPPPIVTIDLDRRPEVDDLPADVSKMKLQLGEGVPTKEEVFLQDDGCHEGEGLCVSEAWAVRSGLYRIHYRELRVACQEDKNVWKTHRELYETKINLANDTIRDMAPTWWDHHKLELGLLGGFLLGVGTTVALTYAVNSGG